MGLLDFLSAGLTSATGAAGAYQNAKANVAQQQKDDGIKQAMQQVAMLKQQHDQEINDALKRAQTSKALQLPPDPTKIHQTNRQFDINNPLPQKPVSQGHVLDPVTGEVKFFDPTKPPQGLKVHPAPKPEPLVITGDPNNPAGPGIFTPRGQAAGQHVPAKVGATGGALAAPMAAKVGQFGEMLKKLQDLHTASEGLDVGLGQSASQDVAEHGIHVPFIGTLPGSKGVGSMLANRTPQFAQYQAALSPFILAAAHALSGARINQDQVTQIRQSIERKPGDSPQVRTQKEKNLVDLLNSIGGSLPAQAITEQEAQMDPAALEALVAKGYKRRVVAPSAPAAGGKTVTVNGKAYHVPD